MNTSSKRTSTRLWFPETESPWGTRFSNDFLPYPASNGRVSLSSASVGAPPAFAVFPQGIRTSQNEDKSVRVQPVSAEYFRALSIPLVAGRPFADADRNGAPRVAIINEKMARHYFRGPIRWENDSPGGIPLPRTSRSSVWSGMPSTTTSGRIPRGWSIFRPSQGSGPNFVQIRAKTHGGRQVTTLVQDVRAAIRTVGPDIRIVSLEPLSAAVNRTLAAERLVSWLSMGFGIVAILLTSVGLYGLLA